MKRSPLTWLSALAFAMALSSPGLAQEPVPAPVPSEETTQPEAAASPSFPLPVAPYEYSVGLGYGFQGKAVRIAIDGVEVLSLVGTPEIEEYAQLLGTKMLKSGVAAKATIQVEVTVGKDSPHTQAIDLAKGLNIHVYRDESGIRVHNTLILVEE